MADDINGIDDTDGSGLCIIFKSTYVEVSDSCVHTHARGPHSRESRGEGPSTSSSCSPNISGSRSSEKEDANECSICQKESGKDSRGHAEGGSLLL